MLCRCKAVRALLGLGTAAALVATGPAPETLLRLALGLACVTLADGDLGEVVGGLKGERVAVGMAGRGVGLGLPHASERPVAPGAVRVVGLGDAGAVGVAVRLPLMTDKLPGSCLGTSPLLLPAGSAEMARMVREGGAWWSN